MDEDFISEKDIVKRMRSHVDGILMLIYTNNFYKKKILELEKEIGKEKSILDDGGIEKILNRQIKDLALSVRAYNCLRSAKIETVYGLLRYSISDLRKFRNIGRKSMLEIITVVEKMGFDWGQEYISTTKAGKKTLKF